MTMASHHKQCISEYIARVCPCDDILQQEMVMMFDSVKSISSKENLLYFY